MKQLPDWWSRARAENLLPPDARAADEESSPSWLVLVFGFLGACLVLIPFLGVLLLALGEAVFRSPTAQITALILAGAAILLLRGRNSLFLAQLGLNTALAAQILWLIGWKGELNWPALLGLLALQLGILAGGRLTWAQRILGVLAAWTALALPLAAGDSSADIFDALFTTWPRNVLLLALLWAAWVTQEKRCLGRPWVLPVNALADGVSVGILLALAGRSTVFAVMLGVAAGGSADAADAGLQTLWRWSWPAWLQAVAVLASAVWLWRHWQPEARSAGLLALVYGALLAACPVLPQAGALALIGTLAAGYGKKRLLWLTLGVLLVSLGNFYYALAWPLADKALLLAVIGAVLAIALLLLRGRQPASTAAAPRQPRWLSGALALATLLPLLAVQWDVAQKEAVIARGQKIYLPLLPRDPRSLLQGDYMALRFDLPPTLRDELEERRQGAPGLRRALAVAELDARGVARLLRLADAEETAGNTLAAHELLLPLQQLKGEWVLVTDAYFFPEGQGRPLARARFGEFRVLPDGRALLVGLADADLKTIQPAPDNDANGTPVADTEE